jgi:hypothetical protein
MTAPFSCLHRMSFTTPPWRVWARAVPALLGVLLLGLAGCGDTAEIESYTVDRPPERRMLAVIVPHGESTWFFKFLGTSKAVTAYEDTFRRFLASVRFQADGEPRWDKLEGWEEDRDRKLRYSTLWRMTKNGIVEISISRLGQDGGALLPNINRWRRQLGLGTLRESLLAEVTETVKVDGIEATLVDLVGPGPSQVEREPPFLYDEPEGWQRIPHPGGPPKESPLAFVTWDLAFRVGGDRGALFTAQSLKGGGGGWYANVLRWRRQLGLGPIEEEDVKKETRSLPVDGQQAKYIDLKGPTGSQTLAAMVSRGGVTWFFTLKGPASVVGENKKAFETCVKSIQF